MEISRYWFGMHWALAVRNGVGFDIEAVDSRATWAVNMDEEVVAIPFSGIVINLPLLTLMVGNHA